MRVSNEIWFYKNLLIFPSIFEVNLYKYPSRWCEDECQVRTGADLARGVSQVLRLPPLRQPGQRRLQGEIVLQIMLHREQSQQVWQVHQGRQCETAVWEYICVVFRSSLARVSPSEENSGTTTASAVTAAPSSSTTANSESSERKNSVIIVLKRLQTLYCKSNHLLFIYRHLHSYIHISNSTCIGLQC